MPHLWLLHLCVFVFALIVEFVVSVAPSTVVVAGAAAEAESVARFVDVAVFVAAGVASVVFGPAFSGRLAEFLNQQFLQLNW